METEGFRANSAFIPALATTPAADLPSPPRSTQTGQTLLKIVHELVGRVQEQMVKASI